MGVEYELFGFMTFISMTTKRIILKYGLFEYWLCISVLHNIRILIKYGKMLGHWRYVKMILFEYYYETHNYYYAGTHQITYPLRSPNRYLLIIRCNKFYLEHILKLNIKIIKKIHKRIIITLVSAWVLVEGKICELVGGVWMSGMCVWEWCLSGMRVCEWCMDEEGCVMSDCVWVVTRGWQDDG